MSNTLQITRLHPYEYEILNFEYLSEQLKSLPEQLFKPLNSTPLTWVQTVEQLKFLVEKLNKEKEIAIDLEVTYFCFLHMKFIEFYFPFQFLES